MSKYIEERPPTLSKSTRFEFYGFKQEVRLFLFLLRGIR